MEYWRYNPKKVFFVFILLLVLLGFWFIIQNIKLFSEKNKSLLATALVSIEEANKSQENRFSLVDVNTTWVSESKNYQLREIKVKIVNGSQGN
jgi:hypothetical protein